MPLGDSYPLKLCGDDRAIQGSKSAHSGIQLLLESVESPMLRVVGSAYHRWKEGPLGILVDYFAASPQELAKLKLNYGPAPAAWPHVDCKGWLDGLNALAAELTGRDVSEFGDGERIFDGEESGLSRVADEVVMALAGVDDARLQSYADDELLEDWEMARYTALRDLARSAMESGRNVYCWVSM